MNDLLDGLFSGRLAMVTVEPDGSTHTRPPKGAVVLAGSFNPLHYGHEGMLAAAARITGRLPAYELSVTNVDKPPIPRAEVERRLAQFRGKARVVLTRAPTFPEKSALMPGTVFVIGFDTATRLFPEKYYPPYDPARDPTHAGSAVALAMNTVRRNRCSFIVAGRVGADGRFLSLPGLDVPPQFRDLLSELPEAVFRADVSSTELRSKRPAANT
jgi:hypothetical protein